MQFYYLEPVKESNIPGNKCRIYCLQSACSDVRLRIFLIFTIAPNRPIALRSSQLTSDSILLSWEQPESDMSQEINYTIESNKIGDSSWSIVDSKLMECSFVVNKLECDVVYKFRVIACSEAGLSEPSEECNVVIEAKGIHMYALARLVTITRLEFYFAAM